MPAVNPRLTITLKPEVHAVLRRLSELTQSSQSSVVGNLLESSLPIFERMLTVLEMAEKLKSEGMRMPSELRANLASAQDKIESQLGINFDIDADEPLPILAAGEVVKRRSGRAAGESAASPAVRPVRAARPSLPPISNRGVTPRQKVGSVPLKSAKKGGRNGSL